MTKILTGTEIDEILRACRASGELADYVEGNEKFFELPPALGLGYWREIKLRVGLSLSLLDVRKRQTHCYKIRQHPLPMPLTFSYYLSGGCFVENDGLKRAHEEKAGKSYFYCLPETSEVECYQAGQRLRQAKIKVMPALMKTFSDRLHELPADIRASIEAPRQAIFCYPGCITPTQRHVLEQLFDCPYQGITRQLYLESKVLELLALHCDQLIGARVSKPQRLPASDIDRIYQAREILRQNMAQPPSLPALARQVQLNERKLKQGFRQVLGTTAFKYLSQYRMEQARELLQTGDMTVQETAQYVGYASRSSFVAAFKKQFDVAPSTYIQRT
ncbi:MAG: AraC family transcriptional regulator [Cyanobacteria bacterium J06554_11]